MNNIILCGSMSLVCGVAKAEDETNGADNILKKSDGYKYTGIRQVLPESKEIELGSRD